MGPVETHLKAEPLNWDTVEARGARWMEYWDKHVRGTGEK
jgi:hypothetical protein